MWIAKLRIRHDDCIIGSRTRKFNITSIGVPIDKFDKGKFSYFYHFETLYGKEDDVNKFINDLKKDKTVTKLERTGNTVFFLVQIPIKHKIPTTHYTKETFWLKPVVVDEQGYEYWEIGSWKREVLNQFIGDLQKERYELKINKISNEKINQIYFPQIMPFLSKQQKQALELAYKRGYYDYPRQVELRDLAKELKISLSTFREHLRRAEKKIMPDLIRNVRDD
ncbi:MAG: helix-turn-helix domain-containing protein [Nanoarchaeota archaeon]|nr:helix-turn-helix domain-containing protein [Nanoarchaeota archaeon]